MKHKKYTQEEVMSRLNTLRKESEALLSIKRKNDKLISRNKDLTKYWEELDLNQYKAF